MVGPSDNIIDVLLVEDNPGDVRLTEEALHASDVEADITVVTRGEEALEYLQQRDQYEAASRPDIVLLDLYLPGVEGFDVLGSIREDPDLRTLPVIILTSSTDEQDVAEGYERHANAYLTKPSDSDEFKEFGRRLVKFWNDFVKLPTDGNR